MGSRRKKIEQTYDYSRGKRKADRQPATPDEVQIVDQTTEGEVGSKFFLRTHALKTEGGLSGADLVNAKEVKLFPEHLAPETLHNIIYSLNELDSLAKEAGKGLFKGKLALIGSRYHIARAVEVARFFGLTDVVPIVSQTALEDLGYGKQYNKDGRPRLDEHGNQIVIPIYDKATKAYDEGTRDNELKWMRAMRQIPEFGVPVLAEIANNERFIATLKHVKGLLGKKGDEFFKTHGLDDLDVKNAERYKLILRAIPRLDPQDEPWMKTDININEVNRATDAYVDLTHDLIKNGRI